MAEAIDVNGDATNNAVKKRWYVVHTYSGMEKSVKKALEEKIASEGMGEFFGEILVPTQQVMEIGKDGKKKVSAKTSFVGYIVVEMAMMDRTWLLVRGTPKVTGFVGGNKQASELKSIPWLLKGEVERLKAKACESETDARPKVQYAKSERIRVISGTFVNFEGPIEDVDNTKGRLKITVPMFGRPTVVDIDFDQVEKVSS